MHLLILYKFFDEFRKSLIVFDQRSRFLQKTNIRW